jgi:hypothetical protein
MTTVDKNLADKIALNNGYYHHDRQVVKIYEYTTFWNGTAYKLMYRDEPFVATQYVVNPKLYWKCKND